MRFGYEYEFRTSHVADVFHVKNSRANLVTRELTAAGILESPHFGVKGSGSSGYGRGRSARPLFTAISRRMALYSVGSGCGAISRYVSRNRRPLQRISNTAPLFSMAANKPRSLCRAYSPCTRMGCSSACSTGQTRTAISSHCSCVGSAGSQVYFLRREFSAITSASNVFSGSAWMGRGGFPASSTV